MNPSTLSRGRIPFWAVPVLAALPLWAYIYAGTLEPPPADDHVALGSDLYAVHCAACHGSQGQGGTGPTFSAGAIYQTWPNFEDHLEWVQLGGADWTEQHGPTYGQQNKPVHGAAMPGFGDRLSDTDLVNIILFERTVLGGPNPEPADDQRLRRVAARLHGAQAATLDEALHSEV